MLHVFTLSHSLSHISGGNKSSQYKRRRKLIDACLIWYEFLWNLKVKILVCFTERIRKFCNLFSQNLWLIRRRRDGVFANVHSNPQSAVDSVYRNLLGQSPVGSKRARGGNWKWETSGRKNVSAWSIQAGPFAACQANFIFQILQLFHFHTERPILITPQG